MARNDIFWKQSRAALLGPIALLQATACIEVPSRTPASVPQPAEATTQPVRGEGEPIVPRDQHETRFPRATPTARHTPVATATVGATPTATPTPVATVAPTRIAATPTAIANPTARMTAQPTPTRQGSAATPVATEIPSVGCVEARRAFDQVASQVALRKTPEFKVGNVLSQVEKCSSLCITAREGDFFKVKLASGEFAFVDKSRVVYPEDPRCPNPEGLAAASSNATCPGGSFKVFDAVKEAVKLREKPGAVAHHTLPNCTVVCKKGTQGNWTEVETADNKRGFVSTPLLIDARVRCP